MMSSDGFKKGRWYNRPMFFPNICMSSPFVDAAAKTQEAAAEVRIQKSGFRISKELQNPVGGEKRQTGLFALASLYG